MASRDLNDGVVQVLIVDGQVKVIGIDRGGPVMYGNDAGDSSPFLIDSLMAGMEFVLERMIPDSTPQDSFDTLAKPTYTWPEPPEGLVQ